MSPTNPIQLLIVLSLFIPSQSTHLQSTDQSFISIVVSQNGLDFIKDLLINKAISSLTPLRVPKIEKNLKIPIVGNVHIVMSNITIYLVDVGSSEVKPGDIGVSIVASGASCNLSMNWHYSYKTFLKPISISDSGKASVQVEGMEVGLTLNLKNQGGALKLSLLQCGFHFKKISITLEGGASWLYQRVVNAFKRLIVSAVENAITKKLEGVVSKLDSLLQGLPKEIPVDDIASLNVTFVNDPSLSNSSIGFEINGLFTRKGNEALPNYYNKYSQPLVLCKDPSKMLGISLDEVVFNSASALFFNAKSMQWIVNKMPNQSLLNTAGWILIIPQLYTKYPNDDMNMNFSLSSPPVMKISSHNLDAIVSADLIIDVLEGGKVIPIACISLVIRVSGSLKVLRNKLVGSVKLDDFDMSLKWSKIGNLHLSLIQPVIRIIFETAILPTANLLLGKGLRLPIIHGFIVQNAEIICSNSTITVCSDVAFAESFELGRTLIHEY